MEKELFQTTLLEKAKAANNNAPIDNLSERTISEVVGMFLPQFADDENITDESWAIPVQMVKTLSGQLRHDTSTGINDFPTLIGNPRAKYVDKTALLYELANGVDQQFFIFRIVACVVVAAHDKADAVRHFGEAHHSVVFAVFSCFARSHRF